MSNGKRIEWLDSVKGFAIICVVLGHLVQGYIKAGLYPDYKTVMIVLNNIAYSFHMPLFFILSGFSFGLAYLEGKAPYVIKKERIINQASNLTILYFGWSIIDWVLRFAFSKYVNTEVSLADLLWIPFKALSELWYLYVLVICYMLTIFFVSKKIKWSCLLGGSVLLYFAYYGIHSLWIMEWAGIKILAYYFFFLLGVLMNKKNEIIQFTSKWYITLMLLVIGVVLGMIFSFNREEEISWADIPVVGSVMALAISLAIIAIAQNVTLRILSLVGRYSLEIYLMHTVISAANRKILAILGINLFEINLIVNLFLSVSIPIVFTIVLKKLGLRDIFFKPFVCVSKFMAKNNNKVKMSGD